MGTFATTGTNDLRNQQSREEETMTLDNKIDSTHERPLFILMVAFVSLSWLVLTSSLTAILAVYVSLIVAMIGDGLRKAQKTLPEADSAESRV
jgi:hypothetical protein